MKLRTLLTTVIMIVCAWMHSAWAQDDITSQYLTNANLSTVDNGWTYYSDDYKYQAWNNTNNATVVPAVEFYSGWGSLEHTNFKFSQTITLPAGDYRIAVNAFYREGNDGNGTNNNKAWIFAGDKKQNVYAMTAADGSSLRAYTSENDMYDAMAMFHDGHFSNAFDFSLAEETEIAVGFEGVFSSIRSWCILGPVKLYKYSLEDYLVDYRLKVAEAEALYDQPMNAEVLQALKDAVVEESSFHLSSEITSAIATLTNAITDANNSVLAYAPMKAIMDNTELLDSYGLSAFNNYDGADVVISAYNNRTFESGDYELSVLKAAFTAGVLATKQPGNGLDMTAYITNPDFDNGNYNGWTTETPYGGNCGIQGGSRMEYWAGNASNRQAASFNYYQVLDNLPQGAYTMSADMFNSLNGEGIYSFSPSCGIYGIAHNEEVALVSEDGDVLKTYTTDNILVFRGKMTIGTKNVTTPIPARWFLFDNVKLTYVRPLTQEEIDANTLPESISLNETAITIPSGGSVKLTATILPENASDKSVTWHSNNENIAIVSHDGIVYAGSAGTAIITATANGADEVAVTCAVTVTNASAPLYYSELSEGDFYIVNAATGKYLGGANNWSTHASLIEHGIPFTLTLEDGKYWLDSHTYNSENYHYLNGSDPTGPWVDADGTGFYITSVGDGKYTISSAEDSEYLSGSVGNTLVNNTGSNPNLSLAQWYLVSKADRDKTLLQATEEHPVDATYYIKNAGVSRNLTEAEYSNNPWKGTYVSDGHDMNRFINASDNADVRQDISNIPNGTYLLKFQGFTNAEGNLVCNNEELSLPTSDMTNVNIISDAFIGGLFQNSISVTVTNHQLNIEGYNGYFDNFELFMTEYIPMTSIATAIDQLTLPIGEYTTITATPTPAGASFEDLTFTSSNTNVAVVDNKGNVEAKGIGNATITVSNGMDNADATVDITVVAGIPNSLSLSPNNTILDANTPSITLIVTTSPSNANKSVIWSSSDESVATVENGVVSAIMSGTVTITAVSAFDDNIHATATVKVNFPETDMAASSVFKDGPRMYTRTLGDNIIKNGAFDYNDGFFGWTDAQKTPTTLSSSNFDLITEDGNTYLRSKKHTGSTGAGSIGTGWPIEEGKSYVFGYRTKAVNEGTTAYHVVSLTNTIGTETQVISSSQTVGTEWTQISYTFTNSDFAYLQFRARWLGENGQLTSFDDFYLAELTNEEVSGNLDYLSDNMPTANVGDDAFQYSQTAVTNAQSLIDAGTASVDEVIAAYNAIKVLNAPSSDKVYNVINVTPGFAHADKALTFKSAAGADLSANSTSMGWTETAGSIYPQGVKFTPVDGILNGYKISYARADGNEVYISTGITSGLGQNTNQIRPTTDISRALTVIVKSIDENTWTLFNTESNQNIGSNGDTGFYTSSGANANVLIQEAAQTEVDVNIKAENKYGSIILPFDAAIPEGIIAYSISGTNGDMLVLNQEESFKANTPYVVCAEDGANTVVAGVGAAFTDLSYTYGLLTGAYTATEAPVGSYVLQNNDGKVGFYQVADGKQPTVGANRAYLTVPAESAGIKAFIFEDLATSIQSVGEGLMNGDIYDLSGRKVSKMQRGGIYLINGQKVMVK